MLLAGPKYTIEPSDNIMTLENSLNISDRGWCNVHSTCINIKYDKPTKPVLSR